MELSLLQRGPIGSFRGSVWGTDVSCLPKNPGPQPVCRGTCANAAPALPPRGAGAAEACAALQAQAKTHAQREGPDPESVAILRDIKAEWMDTDADFTAFSQLRLPQLFEQSLARQGFGAPSPIQRRAVPLALQGRDLVGVAATGSGKTLAFLLPMLLRSLSCQLPAGPFGLVLLPTRELALQVKSCVDALTEEPEEKSAVEMARHLSAVCVWGGGERQKQKRQLRDTGGVWILAATPGRLLDLCIEEEDEGRRPLETVRVLVLDEGDRMLEEGMEEQLDAVARRTALWRQTLFFSATWREEKVGPVALRFCSDPVIVRIEQGDGGEGAWREAGSIRHIKQTVEVFDDENEEEREVQKLARLLDLLRLTLEEEAGKAMVFCMTKKLADTLVEKLAVGGYEAVAVHGNKTQQERIANLERFAGPSANARVLVTTDVLGRGIDIPKVTHVFIYDMPGCIDDYIHRIGRTARGMETEGHAISFFEYANCVPQMAQELLEHLEATGQDAPPELRRIAQEVAEGGRTWKKAKESALSWDLASCEELGAWHAAGFRSWMLEYNTAKGKVSGWLVFGAKGVLHTDTKDGTWRLEEEKMHVEFGGFKLCLQLFPTWQGKKRPNFISATPSAEVLELFS
ncbi:unnamed protein product [Effrenium voratum]|nr:unnamed protein product [Effrenium voratum]